MAERIIELRDISKSYGQVYALGGVNLSVDRGEVVGLIGDNGAGKSTLIKILAGVVTPTSGEILIRGQPVSGWSAARRTGSARWPSVVGQTWSPLMATRSPRSHFSSAR